MKTFLPSLFWGAMSLCGAIFCGDVLLAAAPPGRLADAKERLSKAATTEERFYALTDAAKQTFDDGDFAEAKKYAGELLRIAPQFRKDWNYGNAVQDANVVLGRIAVIEGRIDDAKKCLTAAGKSPGSPQMNSFGPNACLAKDLLEVGETESVIEYLTLCRAFWKPGRAQLAEWIQEIRQGKTPDFGANLL